VATTRHTPMAIILTRRRQRRRDSSECRGIMRGKRTKIKEPKKTKSVGESKADRNGRRAVFHGRPRKVLLGPDVPYHSTPRQLSGWVGVGRPQGEFNTLVIGLPLDTPYKFHDQGDAKWIVIWGKFRGHNNTPFGRPTAGLPAYLVFLVTIN
jgi:hypothetical protein